MDVICSRMETLTRSRSPSGSIRKYWELVFQEQTCGRAARLQLGESFKGEWLFKASKARPNLWPPSKAGQRARGNDKSPCAQPLASQNTGRDASSKGKRQRPEGKDIVKSHVRRVKRGLKSSLPACCHLLLGEYR